MDTHRFLDNRHQILFWIISAGLVIGPLSLAPHALAQQAGRPINRAIGAKPVLRRTRRTARYLLPRLPPPPGKLRTIPRPLRRHHRLLRMLREARLLSKDSNQHSNQHSNRATRTMGSSRPSA